MYQICDFLKFLYPTLKLSIVIAFLQYMYIRTKSL